MPEVKSQFLSDKNTTLGKKRDKVPTVLLRADCFSARAYRRSILFSGFSTTSSVVYDAHLDADETPKKLSER
jgi:hypothetical protein